MKKLPIEFLNQMKALLTPEDYSRFLTDCDKTPYRGIRVNTLKCNINTVLEHIKYAKKNTPFCSKGFYIPYDTTNIGDEPFHHAGAFYVQEPSATSAVTVLDVQKGDRVLDLCAAPGGKTLVIASCMEKEAARDSLCERFHYSLSGISRIYRSKALITGMPLYSTLRGMFQL